MSLQGEILMKWPKHIRILPIPWGEESSGAAHKRSEPPEPQSGTAQLRRNFDDVLHAIRSGASCGNPLVTIVSSASTIRVRVLVPLERDDDEGYWLQTALLNEMKDAIAHPAGTRGKALRNALSESGVQVMYLDRARPKVFGEPDWHKEGRLLM